MPWAQASRTVRIAVTHLPHTTTLHVSGELDVASVPALAQALRAAGNGERRIALDLSRVTACTPLIAELLHTSHHQFRSKGRELVLQRAHSSVVRVLQAHGPPELTTTARPVPLLGSDDVQRRTSLVREALVLALRITGAPMGNAQLLDTESGLLHIVTHHGFQQPFLDFFETVDDRETACGIAAQDQVSTFVEEVSASPVFLGTPALDVLQDAHVNAVASLPITTPDGVLIGVVSVHHHQAKRWSGEQQLTLTRLARAAGHVP